jgi:hypothetical protein
MKIQLPENIDLNCPEEYVLAIEACPERFSFFLYHPAEAAEVFRYRIPDDKKPDAFSCFQDSFFDNEFFTLPFNNVFIINYSQAFTFVPALLFEEKDREEYMKFLFTENAGKILHQAIRHPDMVIIHEMPENRYEFFRRSFAGSRIVHYTAPIIAHFQENEPPENGNRMVINRREEGIDIFCFSRNSFLLSNHFACSQLPDAVYYVLFVWRQLKFNQLKDFIYLMEDNGDLTERLKEYIRNVVPFKITASSLCEL